MKELTLEARSENLDKVEQLEMYAYSSDEGSVTVKCEKEKFLNYARNYKK